MKDLSLIQKNELDVSAYNGLSDDREALLTEIRMFTEIKARASYEIGKRFSYYGTLLKYKHTTENEMLTEWESFLEDAGYNRFRASEEVKIFLFVESLRQYNVQLYNKVMNECSKIQALELSKIKEAFGIEVIETEYFVDKGKHAGQTIAPTNMSVREIKDLRKKLAQLEKENEESVTQLGTIKAENKALIKELQKVEEKNSQIASDFTNLSKENEELVKDLAKAKAEVKVETRVETVVKEVPVEVPVEVLSGDAVKMAENYKALSDELKRTQEKLSMYESNEGYLIADVENIQGNVEGALLDAQVPELIKLMKAIVKRHSNLAENTVGFTKMDLNLFIEMRDTINDLDDYLTKLADNINKYC